MVQCLKKDKEGYILYYRVTENGEQKDGGGLSFDMQIRHDGGDYPEMVLRAVIFAVTGRQSHIEVWTEDVWNLDLTAFGFSFNEGRYEAKSDELKLPLCSCQK